MHKCLENVTDTSSVLNYEEDINMTKKVLFFLDEEHYRNIDETPGEVPERATGRGKGTV